MFYSNYSSFGKILGLMVCPYLYHPNIVHMTSNNNNALIDIDSWEKND